VSAPTATLISAVPVPFTANGDLDRGGLQPLYRFLEAPSGPVRVALDQPSRSQLDTLRSAIGDLT
jgi:hypothetical protein